MAGMTSSLRPKPNPRRAGMASSPRPKPNPRRAEEEAAFDAEIKRALDNAAKGYKAGGKIKKMANGGMCRGMGAATKGGKFSKNG